VAFGRRSGEAGEAINGHRLSVNHRRFPRSYLRQRTPRLFGAGSAAVSVVKTLVLGKF
jgi:hypothetical protein